jgi:hypothetical protein
LSVIVREFVPADFAVFESAASSVSCLVGFMGSNLSKRGHFRALFVYS